MAYNCTATPNNIYCTLNNVGDGLGSLFEGLGSPLGNFLIIVGIAGGIVALVMAITTVIRKR